MTFKSVRAAPQWNWAAQPNNTPVIAVDVFEDKKPNPVFLKIGSRTALAKTLKFWQDHPNCHGGDAFNHVAGDDYDPVDWQSCLPQAQEIIEFWGFNFMQERLAGNSNFTRWQQGVINLVRNPEQPITTEDLKIIVTLPRFTVTQRQLNNLTEKYQSWDGRQSSAPVKLRLADIISRGSKGRRSKTWYAFADQSDQLMIMEIHDNEHSAVFLKSLLTRLLSENNQQLEAVICSSFRPIGKDFTAGLIYDMTDIR